MLISRTTASTWIKKPFPLSLGGCLPELRINYLRVGPTDAPIIYIMPSMSHSALVTSSHAPNEPKLKGWWDQVVGLAESCSIDLQKFQVISASPLGGPYGSSSPVSSRTSDDTSIYGGDFPLITPADQAMLHYTLLQSLQLANRPLHAVIGASMGGMQALQFAALFPQLVQRLIVLCSTGKTSASTQALRAVQRKIVRADPQYQSGLAPPTLGLGIARAAGTIAYRSRDEFDVRFSSKPSMDHFYSDFQQFFDAHQRGQPLTPTATTSMRVPVEDYLDHQSLRFAELTKFDANCWLRLSECMDMVCCTQIGFEFLTTFLSDGSRSVLPR